MDACMAVCMYGCVYACTTSLSTYLKISLHQHVAQTQTPFLTSKTSARQRSQLAFRVDFEVAIYVARAEDTPVEPQMPGIYDEFSIQLSSLCSSRHGWIRYLVGIIELLNGIDPQQVVLHKGINCIPLISNPQRHQDLQALLTPRLHSIQWAPAEHRETRWLMPGAAQVRCRENFLKPIPLTVTYYFMKGIESLTTI